ncbi:FliI/YscN family ATPase, partial [Morganella morganii]|nr:FliI/YscN family ATPase [Morganella morganii]
PSPDVFIGEICLVWQDVTCRVLLGWSLVVGLNEYNTLLSLFGHASVLTLTLVSAPTGCAVTLTFTPQIPCSVIYPSGNTLARTMQITEPANLSISRPVS